VTRRFILGGVESLIDRSQADFRPGIVVLHAQIVDSGMTIMILDNASAWD
jgi:hypothetical protein